MLSGVLNSDRAIKVNIQIMRTFTQLRNMLANHEDLKHKIEVMEKKLQSIDDVRHELTFLRAKYFKEIFNLKMGKVF